VTILHSDGLARTKCVTTGRRLGCSAAMGASQSPGSGMDQFALRLVPCPCRKEEHMTERQVDVLCQLAAGLSNAEIAAALNISRSTVASHVRTMLDRTKAGDRTELVARAYAAGVLRPRTWPPRRSQRRCVLLPESQLRTQTVSAASPSPTGMARAVRPDQAGTASTATTPRRKNQAKASGALDRMPLILRQERSS
jgi:DNA-binding CsgD family transcriptional regulator